MPRSDAITACELQRAGLLDRLRPGLDGGVAQQRVARGLEVLGTEPLDDWRRFGVSARVGDEGEERALGRGTGDQAKFLGRHGVARDELNRVAAVACRAGHERDLGMIPADIQHGDIRRLQRSDLGRIVVLPGRIGLVDRFGHAALVQLLSGLVGETLAIGRVVVKDRDLLVGPMIGQVVAGHDALRVVAANDAENVGTALLGQHRIGRRRRNLQDARRLVDFRCRDRGSGAIVPDDEDHAVS